jgi:hypothetical protein
LDALFDLVLRYRFLEIRVLLASQPAVIVQHREALLGLIQMPGLQVQLPDVFVGAAVFRVDGQGL